jgi:hypothetical protein
MRLALSPIKLSIDTEEIAANDPARIRYARPQRFFEALRAGESDAGGTQKTQKWE